MASRKLLDFTEDEAKTFKVRINSVCPELSMNVPLLDGMGATEWGVYNVLHQWALNGFEASMQRLFAIFPESSKRSITKAVNKLIKRRYLELVRERLANGKFTGVVTWVLTPEAAKLPPKMTRREAAAAKREFMAMHRAPGTPSKDIPVIKDPSEVLEVTGDWQLDAELSEINWCHFEQSMTLRQKVLWNKYFSDVHRAKEKKRNDEAYARYRANKKEEERRQAAIRRNEEFERKRKKELERRAAEKAEKEANMPKTSPGRDYWVNLPEDYDYRDDAEELRKVREAFARPQEETYWTVGGDDEAYDDFGAGTSLSRLGKPQVVTTKSTPMEMFMAEFGERHEALMARRRPYVRGEQPWLDELMDLLDGLDGKPAEEPADGGWTVRQEDAGPMESPQVIEEILEEAEEAGVTVCKTYQEVLDERLAEGGEGPVEDPGLMSEFSFHGEWERASAAGWNALDPGFGEGWAAPSKPQVVTTNSTFTKKPVHDWCQQYMGEHVGLDGIEPGQVPFPEEASRARARLRDSEINNNNVYNGYYDRDASYTEEEIDGSQWLRKGGSPSRDSGNLVDPAVSQSELSGKTVPLGNLTEAQFAAAFEHALRWCPPQEHLADQEALCRPLADALAGEIGGGRYLVRAMDLLTLDGVHRKKLPSYVFKDRSRKIVKMGRDLKWAYETYGDDGYGWVD